METAEDWVRGWVHTHVPNEEAAEVWADRLVDRALTDPDAPLTEAIREELQEGFGTVSENDPTFVEVVKGAMGQHLTKVEVEEYCIPFIRMMEQGLSWLPLGVDIHEDPIPPGLAKGIRWAVQQNWTEEIAQELRELN